MHSLLCSLGNLVRLLLADLLLAPLELVLLRLSATKDRQAARLQQEHAAFSSQVRITRKLQFFFYLSPFLYLIQCLHEEEVREGLFVYPYFSPVRNERHKE